MEINYRFIETHNENFFATISRKDIEDLNLKYVFPLNFNRDKCYKVNCDRLRSLMSDGSLSYNTSNDGAEYVREAQYKNYFNRIPVSTAKMIVEI